MSGAGQAAIARDAGADFTIDRKTEDIAARVAELAGGGEGHCIDRIIEVAFGANLETSLKLLAKSGTIASYSSDAMPEPALPFWPLVFLDANLRFVLVFAMTRAALAEAIAATTGAIEAGRLKHNIAKVLPLERAVEAHELVEARGAGGKVVVTIA